jgi:hypothetical protein
MSISQTVPQVFEMEDEFQAREGCNERLQESGNNSGYYQIRFAIGVVASVATVAVAAMSLYYFGPAMLSPGTGPNAPVITYLAIIPATILIAGIAAPMLIINKFCKTKSGDENRLLQSNARLGQWHGQLSTKLATITADEAILNGRKNGGDGADGGDGAGLTSSELALLDGKLRSLGREKETLDQWIQDINRALPAMAARVDEEGKS